jgi:hypothetical protein
VFLRTSHELLGEVYMPRGNVTIEGQAGGSQIVLSVEEKNEG